MVTHVASKSQDGHPGFRREWGLLASMGATRPLGRVALVVAEGGWERVRVAKRPDSSGDHLGTSHGTILLPRLQSGHCLIERHRLGQNSILSRVKTMLIYAVIREKKKRFEVIRGVQCIYQCVLHDPHDSNPACD